MMKKYIAVVLLLLCAGCAHEQVNPGPGRVTGVRNDLSGINDQALWYLAQVCVDEGKVFLYASQYTDSPAVDRDDIPFAVQFKTAPIYGGFREAATFNRSMLEYIRGRLRLGVCPEHPKVALRERIVKKKQAVPVKNKRHAAIFSGATIIQQKVLVCPVDGRTFIPDDLSRKSGEKKPLVRTGGI
jgi:hypothetical protein